MCESATPITVGLLTISDRCFDGQAEDVSGATLLGLVTGDGLIIGEQSVVSDTLADIQVWRALRVKLNQNKPKWFFFAQAALIKWSDQSRFDVVITTGGTGFTPRDVTPDATKQILHRDAPGIATALMVESLKHTPMAMLSRLTAGIRNSTLIVNFPGSAKACKECYAVLSPIIKHCVNQLRGNTLQVRREHGELTAAVQSAFNDPHLIDYPS